MKTPYQTRVEALEAEGLSTSDAQGVADLEFMRKAAPELVALLSKINTAFYTRTSRKAWLELMEQSKPLLQRARGES